MKLGVRAHDFDKKVAAELAAEIAAAGFSHIQLAPAKALRSPCWSPGAWNGDRTAETGAIFANEGIRIAVLGCYINPIHPAPEARKSELERFAESVRFCASFGCGLVATETGSRNADCSPHPSNRSETAYRDLAESIGALAAEAERYGVCVGVEGVSRHVAYSPGKIGMLLDDIRSPALRVVFDPVNFVEDGSPEETARIIGESFELFGDKIATVHVKDFVPSDASGGGSRAGLSGEFRVVPPGRGRMDWPAILRNIKTLERPPDLILEDMKRSEMASAGEFILECWESA